MHTHSPACAYIRAYLHTDAGTHAHMYVTCTQRCMYTGTPRHVPTGRHAQCAQTHTRIHVPTGTRTMCLFLSWLPAVLALMSPRVTGCSYMAFSCFRDFLCANKLGPSVKGLPMRGHSGSSALPASFLALFTQQRFRSKGNSRFIIVFGFLGSLMCSIFKINNKSTVDLVTDFKGNF